jgi:peptidoglycan-associated lipoprotein
MLNNTRATVDPYRAGVAVAGRTRTARRWVGVAAGVLLLANLAACGTHVKRNPAPLAKVVPQKDRNCNDMLELPQAAPSPGGSSAQRMVAGVDVEGDDVAQSTDLARVVYFDFDSYVVHDEFTATLEANAQYLAANDSRMVRLEGHADERGGREYNLALGQRRSEAVRRILSMLGVKESQMEAVSYGEERPAVVGFDEAAYAKNRRVELTYR